MWRILNQFLKQLVILVFLEILPFEYIVLTSVAGMAQPFQASEKLQRSKSTSQENDSTGM